MDAIRPVSTRMPSTSAVPEVYPVPSASRIGDADARPLEPAASIDTKTVPSASSDERIGYVRDDASHAMVFRVSDAVSGDVIVQIPDEIVLKARVYARQDSAPVGERVEKRV